MPFQLQFVHVLLVVHVVDGAMVPAFGELRPWNFPRPGSTPRGPRHYMPYLCSSVLVFAPTGVLLEISFIQIFQHIRGALTRHDETDAIQGLLHDWPFVLAVNSYST